MDVATLGEFLDTANEHFAAAGSALGDGLWDHAGAARQLGRLAASMARYLDAVTRADAVTRRDIPDWELAAVHMREGARTAMGYLDRAAGSASAVPPPADDPLVRHLEMAVDALVVGGDLLRSHVGTDPEGNYMPRSDWASLLRTEPFVLAVADEVAGWGRRAVHVLDHLAGAPGQVQGLPVLALTNARDLLSAVAGISRQAGTAEHDMVSRRDLLRALPSLALPKCVPPGPGESDADLCDGIIVSARRLRGTSFATARLGGDSPSLSGQTWMQAARASAVISDMACGLTGMLADRSAVLNIPAAAENGLRDASVAFARACSAWRQVTWMWRLVRTDTQNPSSSPVTEATDLLLRMGRLLRGDLGWTPAAKSRTAAREPGSLADGRPELIRVLAAVHEAADAVTRSARADLDGIRAADGLGRLYVSNRIVADPAARSLYVGLSGYRAHLLMNAYHIGIAASIHAVTVLDAVVLQTGAPSKVLGLMRTAAGDSLASEPGYEPELETFVAQRVKYFDRPAHSPLRTRADLDADDVIHAYKDAGLSLTECADRFTASATAIKTVLLENGYKPYPKWADGEPRVGLASDGPPEIQEPPAGLNSDAPVAAVLKELGVADPEVYLRAAALDKAAADLISQATTTSGGTRGVPTSQGRSAAQLAAMDGPPHPDLSRGSGVGRESARAPRSQGLSRATQHPTRTTRG